MAKYFLAFLLVVSSVYGQTTDSDCPEKNGVFADSLQCDRYYECENFVLSEKLCADGLVFADLGVNSGIGGRCDFPFNVDCAGRPELQPANATANCPRQNGYFAHSDPTICNQFFFCASGQANLITCPDGLVFNLNTGTCSWPGEANRVGCQSKDVVAFDCPARVLEADPVGPQFIDPLYADPTDCQYFYVCIGGKEPRRNGCTTGLVFNDLTKRCDRPRNVPDCVDWYKTSEGDLLEPDVLDEVAAPPPKRTNIAGRS